MNLICKNRGTGKTYDLIKMSAETGYQIVVHTDTVKRMVSEKAKEMGLHILPPITRKEMNLGQYRGNTFLIDELETFVQEFGNIYAATINKENVSEDDVYQRNIDILLKDYEKVIANKDYNSGMNILKNIDSLNRQLDMAKYRE
ncbi:MAG: hypothetical protein RR806_03210 [Oscillospiraceae bacterium]